MDDHILLPLLNEGKISSGIRRVASQLRIDYADKNPILLVVLKGAFIFASDLVRQLNFPYTIDFVKASSYRGVACGPLEIDGIPIPSVKGRHILIVEDIVDTGQTLTTLRSMLLNGGALTVRICTLLDKPSGRRVECHVDYYCFSILGEFVVGYGLDLDEQYRGLSTICRLGTSSEAKEDSYAGECNIT